MTYDTRIRAAAARGLNAAGYGSEENQIDEVLAAIESAGRLLRTPLRTGVGAIL